MGKITGEWAELKSFLPESWEEKARESKAVCRTRKVGGAEELLRVELLHFGEGMSLKETSTVAKEGGISDISSVALYHRVRKSGEWLRWMCEGMLEKLGTAFRGYNNKLHWIVPHSGVIKRVFSIVIAERAINIVHVNKRPFPDEIPNARILPSEAVFRIKEIVSPSLAGDERREICAACGNADAKIKADVFV